MIAFPEDIGTYDFCGSSCAAEHVGSLELGKDFLVKQTKLLKPNDIAGHTMEFNVMSNDDTIELGNTVTIQTSGHKRNSDICGGTGKENDLLFPPRKFAWKSFG